MKARSDAPSDAEAEQALSSIGVARRVSSEIVTRTATAVWALGTLVGCAEEPEPEPTAADIIEAEIDGVALDNCGTIETDVTNCNQEAPPADVAPLLECILDAWAECRPARLSFESGSVEGVVNPKTWLVIPVGDSCKLVRYTDWTMDPFGGCKLLRSECAPFDDRYVSGCPWLWPETCTDDVTVLDNTEPGHNLPLPPCK